VSVPYGRGGSRGSSGERASRGVMKSVPHGQEIDHLVPVVLELAGLPRGRVVRERHGIGNHVYRVGREFVVRLGSGSDSHEFGKSCELLSALRGQVRCPELLFCELSGAVVGMPVMVCAYIPGRSLQSVWARMAMEQRRSVYTSVLEELEIIHAFDWRSLEWCSGLGDWAEERRVRMAAAIAEASQDAGLDQELVANYARFWDEHHSALDSADAPCLIHDDIHPGNIIVDDQLQLQGLLDFDDAEILPREVEFWNITDELLALPDSLSIAEIKALLAPRFQFGGEEAKIRYLLNDAYWHLIMLTEGVSWHSTGSCRRSAAFAWQQLFVEGRNDSWFR